MFEIFGGSCICMHHLQVMYALFDGKHEGQDNEFRITAHGNAYIWNCWGDGENTARCTCRTDNKDNSTRATVEKSGHEAQHGSSSGQTDRQTDRRRHGQDKKRTLMLKERGMQKFVLRLIHYVLWVRESSWGGGAFDSIHSSPHRRCCCCECVVCSCVCVCRVNPWSTGRLSSTRLCVVCQCVMCVFCVPCVIA